MKPQSAGGRNRRRKNRGEAPPLPPAEVFQTALAAGSPDRGNRGCAAASRNKIEERPRRRQGEIRKALPAAKRTVQGARILPPQRRGGFPFCRRRRGEKKAPATGAGKRAAQGQKRCPWSKILRHWGSPFSARAHAVTATDRESTPGSWQKTGRSKPDAFYARPPPRSGGGRLKF